MNREQDWKARTFKYGFATDSLGSLRKMESEVYLPICKMGILLMFLTEVLCGCAQNTLKMPEAGSELQGMDHSTALLCSFLLKHLTQVTIIRLDTGLIQHGHSYIMFLCKTLFCMCQVLLFVSNDTFKI